MRSISLLTRFNAAANTCLRRKGCSAVPGKLPPLGVSFPRAWRCKTSEYVPRSTCETPFAPWKRIDKYQASLPAKDLARVKQEGGVISLAEYEKYLGRS